jgi:hypothetical protein
VALRSRLRAIPSANRSREIHLELGRSDEAADFHRTRPLQALPFRIGEHAGLHGPFVPMSFPLDHENDIVYLENLTSSLYLEKPDDVQAYILVFDSLRSSALGPRDSEAAIIDALKTFESGETNHAGT